jgi:hypothetical protein
VALCATAQKPRYRRQAASHKKPFCLGGSVTLVDVYTSCLYTWHMRFTWDEAKRKQNLADHGLDFVDVERVFDGRCLLSRMTGFVTMSSAS